MSSLSASSLVKLINVASPQEKPPAPAACRFFPDGERFAGDAETLRAFVGETGNRAIGRALEPGAG